MHHYLAYHSVELMGRDYAPTSTFSYFTRKRETILRASLGASVWLLVGARGSGHMLYRFAGVYTAERLTSDGGDGCRIEGSGLPFHPPVLVTDSPWFLELKREQNNFSFGFNRILDPVVIEALSALAEKVGRENLGPTSPENPVKSALDLFESCVYTIVSVDILERHAIDGLPMTRSERKPWTTAARLMRDAAGSRQAVPVLFGDAKDCSRLLYWGLLTDITIADAPPSTTYTVDRLRPLLGIHSPQELRLKRTGEFIAPGFIRPYALCQTPDFLESAPRDLAAEVFLCAGEGPAPETLVEGAAITVTVCRYERSQEARRRCIAHHGCVCTVCQMDFASMYGRAIGEGFIHVHHLLPMSDIGDSYVVDPIADMRPVCPNCHAMLHRQNPPFSIERLSEMVRKMRSPANQTCVR